MKRIIYTLFVMALFSIGFAASEDTDTDGLYVGEYVVTDVKGTKWYFNFLNDHTVTVKTAGMSDDDMYYGQISSNSGGVLSFQDFYAGNPPIEFPSFNSRGIHWYITSDGWLYKDRECADAKNPNARLKMTKQ